MILYSPNKIEKPKRLLNVTSAWIGLESIVGDIIERFGIKKNKALEFGVEHGYSIVALSNFFKNVIGVDTFKGDQHTFDKNIPKLYEIVKARMPDNVELVRSRYQDYQDSSHYDLIHVDIVHTYRDTFDCGDWAMQHADMVIFHDTESFNEVRRAVYDLSLKYHVKFYNYPYRYGLGILCHKSLS